MDAIGFVTVYGTLDRWKLFTDEDTIILTGDSGIFHRVGWFLLRKTEEGMRLCRWVTEDWCDEVYPDWKSDDSAD